MTPSAARHALLRQLGVPAEHLPAELPDRSAMRRGELAGRSVVVVLDNAADSEHVRPLLPSGATARLTDLDGARAFPLDVLPKADYAAVAGTAEAH